jgi:hypothetical protein
MVKVAYDKIYPILIDFKYESKEVLKRYKDIVVDSYIVENQENNKNRNSVLVRKKQWRKVNR